MKKILFVSAMFLAPILILFGQSSTYQLSFKITVEEHLHPQFEENGRLYILFGKNPNANLLRPSMWAQGRCIFAKNIHGWKANETLVINNSGAWNSYQPNNFLLTEHPVKGWYVAPKWDFDAVPEGTYYVSIIWDQDGIRHELYTSGNLYSGKMKIEVDKATEIEIQLEDVFKIERYGEHELLKEIELKSDTLSEWWGKPVYLKAGILLPSDYYDNPQKAYPIRYDVAGYNGRYYRMYNYFHRNEQFQDWWLSGEAPQIINVYLDGFGPFGDCYQMDSENNGPYGYALIHELIPYIERQYRNTKSPVTRFVCGCSTGGWVSLALQLFYPDHFNGAVSYAPDPLSFTDFITVDLYNDKNMYVSNYGYENALLRTVYGHTTLTWKDVINYEKIFSAENLVVTSGEAICGMNALLSPRGKDGLPVPVFDQETGKINQEAVRNWRKLDLLEYVKTNWETLGPKINGKIYIQVSDQDDAFLNYGVRRLDEFLKSAENAKSDIVIEYLVMKRHCEGSGQIDRIKRTYRRLLEIENNMDEGR